MSANAADFPYHFAKALSATYFFMGGRYDPVADKFTSSDVSFHIMMALYVFFTVILMLNVLIALINVAFTTGDDNDIWHLVLLESRLHYVSNAENMSFRIPGMRGTHDWFPQEIYYTATHKEVQKFTQKYLEEVGEDPTAAKPFPEVQGRAATAEKPPEFVKMLDKAASATAAAAATSERTRDIDYHLKTLQKDFTTSLAQIRSEADERQKELQQQLTELRDLLTARQ
ncbi:hypothetical protein BGZ99_000458 [Dissophora globulifera]|uniref:Ion transport domain-containing protein n=1 Tax=Dissophora globulifera TaxID=979702 RepID=A0A9P6RPS7_9FUNG|nr:hypothetical protein BGZ99_000458 [Dissophora globulifera]